MVFTNNGRSHSRDWNLWFICLENCDEQDWQYDYITWTINRTNPTQGMWNLCTLTWWITWSHANLSGYGGGSTMTVIAQMVVDQLVIWTVMLISCWIVEWYGMNMLLWVISLLIVSQSKVYSSAHLTSIHVIVYHISRHFLKVSSQFLRGLEGWILIKRDVNKTQATLTVYIGALLNWKRL